MFRSKIDSLDEIAVSEGLYCDPEEDMTRQEFKAESDINNLVTRHGLIPRPVQYGEWDFDVDLSTSMEASRAVGAAYDALPHEVRVQYPDMGSVWAAIASGALKIGSAGVEVPSSSAEPQQAPDEGAR